MLVPFQVRSSNIYLMILLCLEGKSKDHFLKGDGELSAENIFSLRINSSNFPS
jgi:hypothetical protein